MNQANVLNYKQYDKGIRIYDDSLLEVDINRTFEMLNQDIPEDHTEEFEPTITILQDFVTECRGQSSEYTNSMLIKLLKYIKKFPLSDCRRELQKQTLLITFFFLEKA